MTREATIEELIGTIIIGIDAKEDKISFLLDDGRCMIMYHNQDCCESVEVDEIIGDLNDLIGSPILMAECVTNETELPPDRHVDSFTWTFYKLATVKGYVTLRWLGMSNGYYSERVDVKWMISSTPEEKPCESQIIVSAGVSMKSRHHITFDPKACTTFNIIIKWIDSSKASIYSAVGYYIEGDSFVVITRECNDGYLIKSGHTISKIESIMISLNEFDDEQDFINNNE